MNSYALRNISVYAKFSTNFQFFKNINEIHLYLISECICAECIFFIFICVMKLLYIEKYYTIK